MCCFSRPGVFLPGWVAAGRAGEEVPVERQRHGIPVTVHVLPAAPYPAQPVVAAPSRPEPDPHTHPAPQPARFTPPPPSRHCRLGLPLRTQLCSGCRRLFTGSVLGKVVTSVFAGGGGGLLCVCCGMCVCA